MRRIVINVFGVAGEDHYADILSQESHRFLRRAFENPNQLVQHIITCVLQHLSLKLLMKITLF